jgi:hypothetical protein
MVDLRIARAAAPEALAPPDPRGAGALGDAISEAAGVIGGAVRRQGEVDEEIARSEHRIALRAQEDDDNRLAAQQAARLAELGEQLRVDFATFANEAGPGGEGLDERMRTHVAERIAEFDAAFGTNDRVRMRFGDNVAGLAGRTVTQAQLLTMQRRAEARANNSNIVVETTANSIYNHSDTATLPATFQQSLALIETTATAMTDVSPEARSEWRREAVERVTRSMLDGLIARGGHAAAGQLIATGQFDAVLSPEVMRNVRGQIAAGERAERIAADAAASEVRRGVQEEIDTVEALIDANEPVPDSRIAEIERRARAAGIDGDELINFGVLRESNARARVFQGQPVTALRSALTAVRGRMASGQATPEDMRAAEHLETMIEGRDNDTAAPLRTEYESGPQGQLSVAGQLQAMPREDRFRMAERVAPGFGFVVNLTPERQRLAINGRRAREANPDRVSDANTRRVFRAAVGEAGHFYDPAALDQIRVLAADLYAGSFSGAPPEQFDEARYRVALDRAFGGGNDAREGGGLARWNGRPFILPPGYNSQGFGEAWRGAPWRDARQADGSTPSMETVRTRFAPVYFGEDDRGFLYEWHDSQGRALQHANGGAYRLIVPRRRAGAR